MWMFKFFLCLSLLQNFASARVLEVEITHGTLLGSERVTIFNNVKYLSFRGIPYAAPMTGEHKFDPPKPPVIWNTTWLATEYGPDCIQYNPFLQRIRGSENCLFVNVHTPSLKSSECHPVMVSIHAGSWIFGSGSDIIYGPDFLIEQGVVVVTLNYRLGPFGFINTGDASAPGNVGLKDQAFAIRWIRDNIQFFNGCANKITILGESSGAASVHYHLLSPMSRGHFDRAILQSGSATDYWAYTYNPRKSAFDLGRELGITTTDSQILMASLKNISSETILRASLRLNSHRRFSLEEKYIWLPSVEPYIEGAEIFLPDNPMTMIKNGKMADVPIIAGVNLDECSLWLPELLKLVDENKTLVYDNMYTILPDNLNITDIKEAKKVAKDIYSFYFGNREISRTTTTELIEMLNDASFFLQFHITTLVTGEHVKSPIYKYLFTHKSTLGMLKTWRNIGNVSSHADDLTYLWYSKIFRNVPLRNTPSEFLMKLFTKLWTNFAKTGDPTSVMDEHVNFQWIPMGKENNILHLDVNSKMEKGFFPERMNFWVKVYDKLLGEFGELLTLYKQNAAATINCNFIIVLLSIITYLFLTQRNL